MDLETIDTILSVTLRFLGAVGACALFLWGLNKFYLHNIFVSKKDFKASMAHLDRRLEGTLEKLNSAIEASAQKNYAMDRDFAVFRATYNGDVALIKSNMDHQNNMQVETLHSIKNIQNQNMKAVLEMIVEEKLNHK